MGDPKFGDSDSDIIEDAKAKAPIGEGMMGSSGQVARQSVSERGGGCGQGAAYFQRRPFEQGRTGAEAKTHCRRPVQGP